MSACHLCPRDCGADRESGVLGACGAASAMRVARADLHFGEEPVISGERGSGTIFFSHCPLRCVFCQNAAISADGVGQEVDVEWLAGAMLRLQERGAHNVNLVTGTHYAPLIRQSVVMARQLGLGLPIVWNSSGYERQETIALLEDVVDVWMPDFKYWQEHTAAELSSAPDYPQVARAALRRMFSQGPHASFGSDGTLTSGVLVRHLVLPGHTRDSKHVLGWLAQNAPSDVRVSLMSQYTPVERVASHPLLGRRVTQAEYEGVVRHAMRLGLENVFIQEADSASDAYIPEFYDSLPDL